MLIKVEIPNTLIFQKAMLTLLGGTLAFIESLPILESLLVINIDRKSNNQSTSMVSSDTQRAENNASQECIATKNVLPSRQNTFLSTFLSILLSFFLPFFLFRGQNHNIFAVDILP